MLYLIADTSKSLLEATMRNVFPDLRFCALDPLPLAMATETSNYGERNAPTSIRRKAISEFNPDVRGEATSPNFYHGAPARPTRPESRARNCTLRGDLEDLNAKKRLEVIDASIGFASSAEFRRDISDIVSEYPSLARKTTNSNRRVQDHLRSACGDGNIEWLLNDERIRKVSSRGIRKFMRFGTTGSDATNSELKRRLRGISHIHASALRVELRIFQIANLIAITSALYNPTSIQMRKGLVLRRRLNSWSICSDWDICCSEQASSGAPEKHAITHRRTGDSDLLRDWEKGAKKVITNRTQKKETPYRQYIGRARKK